MDEVNRVLEEESLGMQNVHAASTDGQSRVVFTVDCERAEHDALNIRLRESQLFSSVRSLGGPERE